MGIRIADNDHSHSALNGSFITVIFNLYFLKFKSCKIPKMGLCLKKVKNLDQDHSLAHH